MKWKAFSNASNGQQHLFDDTRSTCAAEGAVGVLVARYSAQEQPGSPVREAKTPRVKPRAEIEVIVANPAG
jgi:hypothetical protein